MNNSDMPATAQDADWKKDMEMHIAKPSDYGKPSLDGSGLTKREHFAAMAMQGLCANSCDDAWGMTIIDTTELAVQMADALLLELEKGGES